MAEDHKIIRMRPEAGTPVDQASEELYQLLEKKVEDSLSALHADRHVEKENLRLEIRAIIAEFESRMNQRFQDLYRERAEAAAEPFEITGTAKQIGNVLRKMINVPDLEFIRRSEEVDEFGLDPEFEDQLMPIFEFLHNRYWRVET